MTDTNDNAPTKVVKLGGGHFDPSEYVTPDYEATLPTAEELNELTGGYPIKGIVLIVMNNRGVLTDYVDGVTHLERIAMLDIIRHMAIASGDPSLD